MANRVKEDERNERIIRGLLKLPDNRRCINCNRLGPQYVCTNFWTFVCTTCSGIHREFTHRVKSVSMAKFTSLEVSALQGGGNQRAREIFLKEWDPQRQSSPDGSNVERLRDFIKHVYVDRRYSGERNYGKPPSMKGDKDEFSGNRRADSYQGGSRSPPYEDAYERRYGEMSSPGGRSDERNSSYYDERRSPGYDQGRCRGEYGRSPTRPEVINDWRREDRFGNTRKADDSSMSPARQKDSEISSPPVARPVREILGDNVVPLRIAEPPKANVTRVGDVSSQPQQTTSSSSSVSANAHPVEVKLESNKSLIDFSDPEPPAAAAVLQQTTISESSVPVASTTNDNNWASFDINPEVKVSETPSNMNPLESVLSQLSVSAPPVSGISGVTSAPVAAPQGNASMFPYNAGAPTGMPVNNLGAFLPTGVLAAAPGIQTQPVNTAQAGQWSNIQFPMSRDSSASQHILPTPGGTNQPWSLSIAPETSVGGTQVITNAASGNSFAGMSQPSAGEVKFSGRKELPADLFTMSYPSYYAPMPGWQTRPPHGMGFPMPYPNTAVPLPTIPQMPKSANPFDVNEPPSVQAQSFPSMASLQGALPNMPPPSGLQRTSSLGSPLMPWNPSQPVPYQTGLASHTPSYGLAMPPRPYMAQQLPNNLPSSGHMGTGGFAGEGAASFAARNSEQQYGGRYSAPATPQPFSSSGGNPFG